MLCHEMVGSVKVRMWLRDAEEAAMQQARNVARLPFVRGMALMPDAHMGFGVPIGSVILTKDVVLPGAVGVDIGCGMCAAQVALMEMSDDQLAKIMAQVRRVVPVGYAHHDHDVHPNWEGWAYIPEVPILLQEMPSARRQLKTLGGGNHFIEFQRNDQGFVCVMLHSGSRNLGFKVANHYLKQAKDLCDAQGVVLADPDLAHLNRYEAAGVEYLQAMEFCVRFAKHSRMLMMNAILEVVSDQTKGSVVGELIDISHNYAAMERHQEEDLMVHRKGAVRVTRDIIGIIPGSMGTSSYLVRGLDNAEAYYSCSHGAGRRMGRKQACWTLDLAAELGRMSGIQHGMHGSNQLDEAPGAYKDIDVVMENQRDLVQVVSKLQPIGSIKG